MNYVKHDGDIFVRLKDIEGIVKSNEKLLEEAGVSFIIGNKVKGGF